MRRWAFNLAAGLSLALCVLSAVFWVRSQRRMDVLDHYSGTTSHVQLSTPKGRVWVYWGTPAPGSPGEWDYRRYDAVDLRVPPRPLVWEVRAGQGTVSLHFWPIVAAFALAPVGWLLNGPLRRKRLGLCVRCGYDLRATPERCPECGTVKSPPKV